MASNGCLLVFMLCLISPATMVLAHTHSYYTACQVASDPKALFKYKCCGLVVGVENKLINGLEKLVNNVETLTCDAVTGLFKELGCLTDGILDLNGILQFVQSLLTNIPIVKDVVNALEPTCFSDKSRYFQSDSGCPSLDLVYCLTRTINFNCRLSTASSHCTRLSSCVHQCKYGY